MGYNPSYKCINPAYPIYNWGYNPLTKWDKPPSSLSFKVHICGEPTCMEEKKQLNHLNCWNYSGPTIFKQHFGSTTQRTCGNFNFKQLSHAKYNSPTHPITLAG